MSIRIISALALSLSLVACGGDNGVTPVPDSGTPDSHVPDSRVVEVPSTYEFESRFIAGRSSVSYTGQIFRQLLIADLTAYIGRITADIDSGTWTPQAGEVTTGFNSYYQFDSDGWGDTMITLATDPPLRQVTFNDLTTGANLQSKVAGNDPYGQHKDWNTEFRGWREGEASSPDALIQYWVSLLDDMTMERAAGNIPLDPAGAAITRVFITDKGQDLQQLIQKFLLGAVTFSQGVDDYLDDDRSGSGLNASNLQYEDRAYSQLEHAWDEAFGYFGAARNYGEYTDEEIAGAGGRDGWSRGYHDTDGDGRIDLRSEYNFGTSTNAAKRDRGSSSEASTDFTKVIYDAFLAGRTIIASADGELDEDELSKLRVQRDIIVSNWEMVIAATALHYINDTLRDMGTFGTESYNFNNHAKHWSEMKGFALGLQFSRFSPLGDDKFVELHDLMGDAPVLPNAPQSEIDQYRENLLAARAIMAEAYDVHPSNVGDDEGMNGW